MRLTRLGAVLMGLILVFIAANVVFWGFGLAMHMSAYAQTVVFIFDAIGIGFFAMFLTGRTPFSMYLIRSGRALPPSDDETVEKLTE